MEKRAVENDNGKRLIYYEFEESDLAGDEDREVAVDDDEVADDRLDRGADDDAERGGIETEG